ncbi:MAG TPA: hypothetical protein VMF61_11180 [Candidatus Acidoferrales bacterium]|nr:hypothetical protein [Candidatus Acidoferrales bacterium]
MKLFAKTTIAGLALAAIIGPVAMSAPASAQNYMNGEPAYTTWQPQWDQYRFDRHHVMLGTVAAFAPYRLTVDRRDGVTQTIDLKNGTVIFPTGATPSPGERVALVGYWSNGTFIANRVILRG